MTSRFSTRVFLCLVAGLAAVAATHAESQAPPGIGPSDEVAAVYLVPITMHLEEQVTALQRYYRETLNLDVQVLPPFDPDLSAWDTPRRRWSAEALLDQLIEREEARVRRGHVVVIAITADDLSSKKDGWIFGWWSAARVSVISYARMDPQWYGKEANSDVLNSRLRHMVSRYIGRSYFDLPATRERTSPLYDDLTSLAALDAISDDLAQAGFFSVRPLLDTSLPVNLFTGLYIHHDVDFALDDAPRVSFERTYRTRDTQSRPFGVGSNHSYGMFLTGDTKAFSFIDLILADGGRVHYRRTDDGIGLAGAVYTHDDTPSQFLHSRLSWKGYDWLIELADGESYRFPDCNPAAKKMCTESRYTDQYGRQTLMTFDPRQNLAKLESEHHHTIELHYDDRDRVILAWDDADHWMSYQYDAGGRLVGTEYSDGTRQEYAYDERARMVLFRNWWFTETMAYDEHGRCTRLERHQLTHTDAAGHTFDRHDIFEFAYTTDAATGAMRQVTETTGNARRTVTFNPRGYELADTYVAGSQETQQTLVDRDEASNVPRHVSVACRVADRAATSSEEVSQGQNEAALIRRVRRACDVEAAHAPARH